MLRRTSPVVSSARVDGGMPGYMRFLYAWIPGAADAGLASLGTTGLAAAAVAVVLVAGAVGARVSPTVVTVVVVEQAVIGRGRSEAEP